MKSIHLPKQPTTFIGKSPNLEKLLSLDGVQQESRNALFEEGKKLRRGEEIIVRYEKYSFP